MRADAVKRGDRHHPYAALHLAAFQGYPVRKQRSCGPASRRLVVLAFYAVARVSVGNTFIACMLTIVGYSINATIVIFDVSVRTWQQPKRKRIMEGAGQQQYHPDS